MSKTYYAAVNKGATALYLIENPGNVPVDVRGFLDENGSRNTQKTADAFAWAKARGAGTFISVDVDALPLGKLELPHPWKNGGDDSKKPRLWVTADCHFELEADADTDADGSPRAQAIDPDSGQVQTSLGKPRWEGEGQYVNSETIPYVVMPGNWNEVCAKEDPRLKLELYDMVRLEWKGKVCYAIVADVGPKDRVGEISIAAATKLGFDVWNADKTRVVRGIPHGVKYDFIPQTYANGRYKKPKNAEEIHALGSHLWASREKPQWKFKGKGILLNPGHGKTDSGALGKNRNITEYALNMLQANTLAEEFTRLGIPFEIITQDNTGGYLEPLGEAAKGFDLFLSLHQNAFDGKEHGAEVCVPPVSNAVEDALGKAIVAAVSKALGITNRGLKPRNLAVLRGAGKVNCPALLVESQFIDDETDEAKAKAATVTAANAILGAITDFFS